MSHSDLLSEQSDEQSDEQSGEQYIIKVIIESEIPRVRNLLLTIGGKHIREFPPHINKSLTSDNPFWFVIIYNDEQYEILVREKVYITLDSATLTIS